jgi:two-component system response regulator HydG
MEHAHRSAPVLEPPAGLGRLVLDVQAAIDGGLPADSLELHIGFYRVGPSGSRAARPEENTRAARWLAALAPSEGLPIGRAEQVLRLPVSFPVLARIRWSDGGGAPSGLGSRLAKLSGALEGIDPLLRVEACAPSLGPELARLGRVAASPLSVLLIGETGTGKEVVAQAVHEASGRPGRLVAENCAALPESLLEAELFGARRGAFTGSGDSRRGLLLEADGGTLLLDEIGEMPAAVQAKLLRALQEKEVRPLGAARPVPFDARLLAATNCESIGSRRRYGLRADLFYRLATIIVELPPLRQRRRDVPWLSAALIARAAEEGIGPGVRLSPGALDRLAEHDFPGNVRELDNVLRQAASLASGPTIGAGLICAAVGGSPRVPWEAQMIRDALASCGGVKSAAARRLGWTRQKLYRRLHKLGLGPSRPPAPDGIERR